MAFQIDALLRDFADNNRTQIIIAALIIAALVIWWWLPKWGVKRLALKIRDPKARADIEDNFRKTLSQLIGGAAILAGAWLTFQTAQTQISSQQRAAHDLLISNQVSKGFEQLASKDPVMRLGGIYALEGVMNDGVVNEGVMNDKTFLQYHRPVLETLCALTRADDRETRL
jgi:hypothetical protein